LQDRRGAQRNYEVTEVNEMLQGMERFRGIFICTTNLMDRIDQAALRRFTFKIAFKPLTVAQREAFFVAEGCAGDVLGLTPVVTKRLAVLEHLCAGEFAAVKRQAATGFSGAAGSRAPHQTRGAGCPRHGFFAVISPGAEAWARAYPRN
jgi:SpoVK/Ycf46/Vps4 family AAA+-type ATPase